MNRWSGAGPVIARAGVVAVLVLGLLLEIVVTAGAPPSLLVGVVKLLATAGVCAAAAYVVIGRSAVSDGDDASPRRAFDTATTGRRPAAAAAAGASGSGARESGAVVAAATARDRSDGRHSGAAGSGEPDPGTAAAVPHRPGTRDPHRAAIGLGAAATLAIGSMLVAQATDVTAGWRAPPAPVACLALLIVTAAAVRHLTSAWAAILAAAAALVPTVAFRTAYTGTVTLVMTAGWIAAVVIGAWLRATDARRRRLRDSIRRAERTALARDLHDVAAHHLTALIIQAQVAQVAPGETRTALAEIERAGVEALDSLRRVARLLRDPNAEPETPGTVADLVAAFAARDPAAPDRPAIEARLDLPNGPQPRDWPPGVALALYRITQEALTNVARHAHDARHVTVTLAHDRRSIRLTITDDGQKGTGTEDRPAGGHGIEGMRERAAALGGTLTAAPDGGWAVRLTLPAPRRRR
ncbi:sensor histidine kinase [Catenuloplanes atrovinosus]|uniref:histidine kinase n=1 Tax=Catenuloplanes atrovinosus TaxID=137266 RepID=A0AAE3YJ46_9ACTN|nr:histidine kinase [Catenuloplanes atrovinosus]MDR7274793.1 signal transduction histidine kinase [Catenuloplanes atrovinosus]